MVVLVTELAKRSDKLGGLIATLPITTILTLIWRHIETQAKSELANHGWYTFWYVIPNPADVSCFTGLIATIIFWPTLWVSALITIVCFALFAFVLRRFGIDLL